MRKVDLAEQNKRWLEQLHENGYRLTDARRAVIDVVANTDRVLKPIEVYEIAKDIYPRLGLVTVYRTLEKLEELGLILRVHQPVDCQAFVPAWEGHKHLLLCTQCGRFEYFEGENLELFFRGIGQETGYTIQDHWMQLFGICTACAERSD